MKSIKKILSIVLMFVLCVGMTLPALAASPSGSCGKNVTWSLNQNTGVLTVKGSGAMNNYQQKDSGASYGYSPYSTAPWWNYRHDIRQVVIEDGVTHIGDHAFASYDNLMDDSCLYDKLQSVSIAGSVTSIGASAFSLSTALTELNLSNGLRTIGNMAFWECYNLSSYTIPNTVTSIGDYAFQQISKVTRVTIPYSVQKIGRYAIGFSMSQYQDPPPKISEFTITGYADTAAESYARVHGFPFNAVQTVSGFYDVLQSDWFAGDVAYVVNKGLMGGSDTRLFSPNGPMTRAMTVAALYRLERSPSVSGSSFSDVKASDWYGPAVQWASQNNIVSGYGDGKFGPNDTLTRQQFATILYRYAQYKNYDTTISGDLAQYTDRGAVSSYAREAVSWAVGKNLIGGTSSTTLTPSGSTTRAQGAAILHRFDEKIVVPGGTNTPASAPSTVDPLTIYGNLLKTYRAVVNKEKEWDPDELLGDPSFYNIYTSYYSRPGYAFLDIDQDGTPELLLGPASSTSDWSNGLIYDLYTYHNGAVVKVLESAERNRYYLLDSGQFRNEWSNGASDSGEDYYVLEKGTTALKPVQGSSSSAKRSIDFTSF